MLDRRPLPGEIVIDKQGARYKTITCGMKWYKGTQLDGKKEDVAMHVLEIAKIEPPAGEAPVEPVEKRTKLQQAQDDVAGGRLIRPEERLARKEEADLRSPDCVPEDFD